MAWDPSLFGGLSTVRLPTSLLFTPDIVLFNNADTRLEDKRDVLITIYSNGEISWLPPALYRSTCALDTKWFPFDMQNCSLKFGSWTYETTQLDLVFMDGRSTVDLAEYTPSNEWQILDAPAVKHIKTINGRNYTDLTFYLILRRNGGFYSYILLVPCVLLAFLTMVRKLFFKTTKSRVVWFTISKGRLLVATGNASQNDSRHEYFRRIFSSSTFVGRPCASCIQRSSHYR